MISLNVSRFCFFANYESSSSCFHRWIQVATVTLLSSPHSALCAHGWPRRLPVWRRKWLGCCPSWSDTPAATCRARVRSRASRTGWPRCPSRRRGGRGRAKKLWGKDGGFGRYLSLSDSASYLASSSLSSGTSSQLCATCQPRKVQGRCCSPWTPRPCWWTSCLSAGLPSRGQVGLHWPGIPAWRQPARHSSTSPSQSQRESGSGFSKWNTHQTCFFSIGRHWDVTIHAVFHGIPVPVSFLGRTLVSEHWRPFWVKHFLFWCTNPLSWF